MLAGKPLAAMRFAVPTNLMLDTLDPVVSDSFERALSALSRAGAQLIEINLMPLNSLARNRSHDFTRVA